MPGNYQTLSQAQVEELIQQVGERLEAATEDYAEACDDAAEAEVEYKMQYARQVVLLADVKMSEHIRTARATIRSEGTFRTWKLAAAKQTRIKELLLTLRGRQDALRTIAANVRAQT